MRYASLISLLSAALLLGGGQNAGKVPSTEWIEDLDEARKLARQTGKPLFVTFRCER